MTPKKPLLRASRVPSASQVPSASRTRTTGSARLVPSSPLSKLPIWAGMLFRWGLVALIIALLITRISALNTAKDQARKVEADYAGWQQRQAQVQQELDRFNDPEWRESYWKWRTMRHSPGEYYIRFLDQGSF